MRLIDADAIELEPDQYNAFAMNGVAFAGRFGGKTAAMVQNALKHMIDNAHTVDAVPVVHGRWMWEGQFKACSECGTYIDWDNTLGANHWRYCPQCGAKMDGKER